VAAGDDLVNLILRFEVHVLADGLVVDKRNGVLGIRLGQTKQVAHGIDGDEDARVGTVIAVAANLGDHADYVEADSVQENRGPDGGASREHVFEQFPSHHGDAAALSVVLVIEPAPRIDGYIANLVVVGGHAEDLAVGRTVIADGADIFAIQHRGYGTYELRLLADRKVIRVGEVVSSPGLRAALDRGNASGKHEHYVLSERGELFFLTAAEAFSEAYQEQQRTHAPRDPEHGEERQ
jgi:hypothetical protein